MADTIVCTPEALLADSGCFSCIPKGNQQQVLIYLLAVMAGGSLDPATLVAESKCMACIPREMREQVITYLLCQIANATP